MSRLLLRNTLFYLPAQFLGPLAQFAMVVIWTHLLDPAAFGVVTFVVAAQEVTALVGVVWWSVYMLRFRLRYVEAQESARFRAMDARVVALGAAAQALMAPLCLLAIGVRPDLALSAALTLYLVVRLALGHFSEWARSDHRIAAYTFAQIAAPVAGASLSVATITLFGATPPVTLVGLALGQAVGVVGLMTSLGRRPGFGAFDRALFRDAMRYGVPLVAAGAFSWIAGNGVRVLVQYVDGVFAVGLLSAGWGLGQRISNVIAMVCTAAAYPLAVDKMESGDREGALAQVSTNGSLMLALLTPAAVGLAMLSGPLVDLMIAAEYRETTRLVMPLAMIAGAVRTLRNHSADQACLLLDRTRVSMISNLADAALTTAGAAFGLASGGIIGAVVGAVAGTTVAAAGAVAYAAIWLRLRLNIGVALRIGVAAAAMAVVLWWAPTPAGVFSIAAKIALGAIVYLVAAMLVLPELRGLIMNRSRPDARRASDAV
jgi:O-antigen/teichoic acid export membrane protein